MSIKTMTVLELRLTVDYEARAKQSILDTPPHTAIRTKKSDEQPTDQTTTTEAEAPSTTSSSASAKQAAARMEKVMDGERWVEQRMDTLKMRVFLSGEMTELPAKIEKRMLQFDANERNSRGETILIGAIRYMMEPTRQMKFMNLLVRAGSDPNLPETKHSRTPLMFACMDRNEGAVRWLLNLSQVDLIAQDRLGNTALMYAALYGHDNIVNLLVDNLTRRWSFDVFRVRNCMGHTAESLARKNGREECAALLRRERLQMLQRMHRQLALIHLSAQMKGWNGFNTIQKAKNAFLRSSTRSDLSKGRKVTYSNQVDTNDGAKSNESTTMSDKSLSVQKTPRPAGVREKSASLPSLSESVHDAVLPENIFKEKYNDMS